MACSIYFTADNMPVSRKLELAYGICKECQIEEICDKKQQKILSCNQTVLDYFSDHKRGFLSYPHKGGWKQQAEWFKSLYAIVESEYNRIMQINQEKASKRAK